MRELPSRISLALILFFSLDLIVVSTNFVNISLMDGGYVKGEGGNRNGDGPRVKAIAVVNSSFVHNLTAGNSLYIHRQKFTNVTMVGIIQDFNETTTKIEFKLDDGEGIPVTIQKWKTNQTVEMDMEGRLVRVFGNPRRTAQAPEAHIIAFQIIPIRDLNELTMHLIEVVAASMVLNKRKNNILAGLPAQSGFPNSSNQRQAGVQSKRQSQVAQNNQDAPVSMPGMKPNDAMVLKAIAACPDATGVSRDVLSRSLSSLNQSAIMASLDFLMNEGHIYTTTDDYHYKSTDG